MVVLGQSDGTRIKLQCKSMNLGNGSFRILDSNIDISGALPRFENVRIMLGLDRFPLNFPPLFGDNKFGRHFASNSKLNVPDFPSDAAATKVSRQGPAMLNAGLVL